MHKNWSTVLPEKAAPVVALATLLTTGELLVVVETHKELFSRLYMDGWRDGLNRLWRDGVTILPRPAEKIATAKKQPSRPGPRKNKQTPPRPVPSKKKKKATPSRLGKKKQPPRPASENKNNRPVPPRKKNKTAPSRLEKKTKRPVPP